MTEPDDLFSVRTHYWLGSYQTSINEANALTKLKPNLAAEKEEWIYRSYVGLGQYSLVINEISDSSSVPIGKRAYKLLAQYYDNPSNKDGVIAKLQDSLSDSAHNQNRTLKTVAATIYLNENNYKEAYRILKDPNNLEHHAMLVELYLKMFRVDLAVKQLKLMKGIDEDAVLTMLASAWLNMAPGSQKIQDAVYIYEELIDKYNSSVLLLNGLAVAKMHLGLFEEAETALNDCLTKNPSDPDALANLIVIGHHLNKAPEVISRYTAQLRAKAPGHELLTSLDNFNSSFDRVSSALG